jgi:CO dehydrogenase nickel-insertion accessory protein CooC1
VRMVIASRVEHMDPGCMCCGVNPVNLVRKLEHGDRTVVCDLEAGIGTVDGIGEGVVDVLLVVANPTGKSLEVARRAIEIADGVTEIVVVANRVAGEADLDLMREVLGERELFVIPEDDVIAAADRDGIAPIDLDPDSPGVAALVRLAERVAGAPVAA